MAGHVSADDLAAVSVGASVWITIIVTLIGLLLASSPLIAHAVGANERKQIPFLVQQAFYQAAMFTVVGWLLVWAAMPIFWPSGPGECCGGQGASFSGCCGLGLARVLVFPRLL